jgi:hypothetical protein
MNFNASRGLFVACLVASPLIANAQTSGVPILRVEANCKATTELDKSMGIAEPQSYDACMHDEKSAQEQLRPIWAGTPEAVRKDCTGEAVAGGIESYVDLLSCIQMNGDAQQGTPATSLRGASKNRNKKG